MATVLEARAIITAEDRTGPAFAAIERHIAAIGKQASAINAVSRQVSRVSAGVAQTSRGISARGAMQGEIGMGAGMMAGASGIATVVAGSMAARAAVKVASDRAHEQVRMEASGMSREEIRDAQSEAANLAAKFPSLGQTEIMHMLRNARTIVGSYHEAAEIMEPLAKLRIVAQGARPGQDVSEDFDQLVKGLEIKGVTQNPKQFRDYIEGIAKGLNAFGDTLKPYQYYEMFKYGRQATPGLSEKFILSTAPTLAQELGGSSYGKAVAAFNSAIVSNVMKHSAIKDFVSLGLVNKDDVLYNKTGDAKGFKPGKHVQGWALAQSDPNEWVKQYLIPALEKAGVTDKGEILQRIGALFQNQTAAQMVGLLVTQQSRIDKDAAILRGAYGTDAADRYMRSDPHIAWEGLKKSVESLLGTMGEGTMTALAGPMTDVAQAIGGYTKRLEELNNKEKQNPDSVAPAGQPKINGLLNRIFTGVDSDGSLADAQAIKDRRHRALAMHRLDLDYSQGTEDLWRELDDAKRGAESAEARGDKNRATSLRLKAAERQRRLDDLMDADFARTEAQRASEAADSAVGGYHDAMRFAGYRPHGRTPFTVPGSMTTSAGAAAFSTSLGYANYDANGAPRPSPADQVAEAVKSIKLEPVNVTGEATVTGNFTVDVKADAGLKADIAEIKQIKASLPLSSTGHPKSALGPSMPEAAPTGQSGAP